MSTNTTPTFNDIINETQELKIDVAKFEMIKNALNWFDNIDFEQTYIDGEGMFCKELFMNDFKKEMVKHLKVLY
jgi:hypothetical protein